MKLSLPISRYTQMILVYYMVIMMARLVMSSNIGEPSTYKYKYKYLYVYEENIPLFVGRSGSAMLSGLGISIVRSGPFPSASPFYKAVSIALCI